VNGSEDNYFTTNADSISGGLIEQLGQFVSDKPETRLIIIDTVQRIRGADENRSGYAFDYEDMNKIKELADRLKIAILLVHHTRKMPDSDPFNTISGTTGLTGCAYTVFVFEKPKRAENKAIFHITGRDVEDMRLNLEFDREKKIWRFISFATGGENPAEKLIDTIVRLIAEHSSFSGTATELLTALKTIDSSITVTPNILSRMLKENAITLEKSHKISVSFNRTNNTRIINLTVCDDDDDLPPSPQSEKYPYAEITVTPSPSVNKPV
jgi:hypothetical protein